MLPLMPSQPAPAPQGPAPDMLSMLGAGPPMGNPTDLSGALAGAIRQFEQMQSMILELARSFPGSEDAARQMMDGLERWRQQLVVGMTPPSAGMPGAQGMMA